MDQSIAILWFKNACKSFIVIKYPYNRTVPTFQKLLLTAVVILKSFFIFFPAGNSQENMALNKDWWKILEGPFLEEVHVLNFKVLVCLVEK